MALSIVSITPNTGRTSGGALVKIVGTDFDLPTESDPVSMSVKFGGEVARHVQVRSSTLLTCVAPEHDKGAVDVEVQNLLNPDTVTEAGGFIYSLPDLKLESGLTFITRTLIKKFKRQILENVVLSTHTDFDGDVSDGLQIAELAALPAMIILGPRLTDNRFYSSNEPRIVAVGGGVSEIRRETKVVDMEFDYELASDSMVQLLNLKHRMVMFFQQNKHLEVEKVPGTPSEGKVLYEMELQAGGDPDTNPAGTNSNTQMARGSFLVRGVPLEEEFALALKETAEVLEDAILETEEIP